MRAIIKNIFFSLFILLPFLSSSQKVGLVLSGGGAKGLVHIGIIKALEENNIPIDYVVGTSMGAIVSGFYASGYSPDSIIKVLKTPDFTDYSKGLIPERFAYYYKKGQDDASIFHIPVSFSDKKINLQLPTNYISTKSMDIGVCKYFSLSSAKAGNNFNNLFVPFRCVASDVYYNRQKVFSKGDLGTTIRASMAFPLLFKAVEIDSVLYFDGGIYNNFPVDVMKKEFNPDYIIGVVVVSLDEKATEDNVLLQISNLVVSNTQEFSVPESEGITIRIDVPSVGLLDFHKVDELVKIGYNHGLTLVDSIKKNVHREVPADSLELRRKIFKSQLPALVVDDIKINGVSKHAEKYVEKTFNINSDSMSMKDFEKKYFKLMSDPQINYATPQLIYNDSTGKFAVKLKTKLETPFDIHVGASVSTLGLNQGYLGFTYKYLKHTSIISNLKLNFGQLHSSGSLSVRWDLPFKRPFSVEFQANNSKYNYNKPVNNFLFFNNQTPVLSLYDRHLRLDIYTPLSFLSVLKLGYVAGIQKYVYYQNEVAESEETEDNTVIKLQSWHLSYLRNNTNYIYYPTKGSRSLVSLRYSIANERYTSGSSGLVINYDYNNLNWFEITAETENYYEVFKYLTIGVYGKLVYSNNSFLTNYTSTIMSLPSCSPIIHSTMIFAKNYRAYSYACIGLRPIITFNNRLSLRLEAYFFAPYQRILQEEVETNVYRAYFSEKFRYFDFIYSINGVYNSPIGPISISVNHYTAEKVRTFFMCHFGFYIFNKTAFGV